MKQTRFAKVAGFTLDQTILVVAVIAILATIIISSVAWEVLSRANSTKLTAHMDQISDAIGQYYQDDHGSGKYTWPANAAALAPYLAGYTDNGSGNLLTPFGSSSNRSILTLNTTGKVLSSAGSTGGSNCAGGELDCYFTITLTNIQAQELEIANETIDGAGEKGTDRGNNGRLRWDSSQSGSTEVTATYYALKK
jgi:type II secretory pathway pseudopilin PulG